jgi:hypothetical protein
VYFRCVFILSFAAFVFGGCIFAGGGSDGEPDAGDSDAVDAVDPDASDADDPDASDVDVDSMTDADDDADTASEINCPEDCTLTARYRTDDGELADLDGATLGLFEEVELVAVVEGAGGQTPTGCETDWTLESPGDRPRLSLDSSADGAALVPVALSSGGEQSVTALARCEEGEVTTTASPSVGYPATVPDGADGEPAPIFWWSAASEKSAGPVSGGEDIWTWRTVDPTQEFFLGIRNTEFVPSFEGDRSEPHIQFGETSALGTRIPSIPDSQAHTQPAVSIIVRLRIDEPLSNETALPIIESCSGPNNQFRYRFDSAGAQSFQVAFDGTRLETAADNAIQPDTWRTVGMVWGNEGATLYLDGVRQNDSPLSFDGGSEMDWSWDSLLRGCNIDRPPTIVDVSDLVVVEAALTPTEVSTVIDDFIGALSLPGPPP